MKLTRRNALTASVAALGSSLVAPAVKASPGWPTKAPIKLIATFPPGGSVTFTVTATAPASGSFVNTANVTAPAGVTDPNLANNTSTVTTGVGTVPTTADLAVIKSGPASVAPNGAMTYTILVTNGGPGAANGATVTDTVPLSGVTWTCGNATAGAVCGAANGSGNINTTITTFPAGASVTFTVTGTAPASGTLTNTVTVATPAGVTDPNAGNNSSTVTTTVTATPTTADLYAVKTGPSTVGPNASITYMVVVGNSGPSAVTNATFSDVVPSAVTGVNWTCGGATAGASCGTTSGSGNNISTTIASLPVGGTVIFTITGTGPSSGSFVNSALITPPSGVSDPDPTDNIAGPVITNVVITADLAITKTDGSATYTPGGTVIYNIVVTNNGPDAVTNAAVADTLPAAVTSAAWTCTASAGSSCGAANGAGNIASTVSLLSGGTATYTVTAQISSGATGNLVNTATVTAPPGVTDPTPGNNSATDTDTPNTITDLAITKTDGAATYTPGGGITYTIVVTNNGPSNATGASIADTIPASITGTTITCTPSGTASCGANGSSGNNLSFTGVNINAGAANFVTITVSGTVGAGTTGNLVNTAVVTVGAGQTDPTAGNNTATDTDTPNAITDLAITKTDGSATYTAGGAITYTIVVTNNGPSNATGVSVADTIPASITGTTISCVANGAASCGTNGSAGNALSFTNVSIATGPANSLTITVSGTVGAGTTGNLTNTATVTAGAGQTDPTAGNNSATDTDTPNAITDLAITKTDGSATYMPGNAITYTIVVTNNGPSNATGASIADTIPASITGTTITCTPSGTASCGTNASAGNNLSFTGVNINAGAANFVTITVSGTVNPGTTGNLTNTATVTPGANQTDPNQANNSATDIDSNNPQADLSITKTDGSATYVPGTSTTYTIVVTNNGPSSVTSASVIDSLPASISSATWTCLASAGGFCAASSGTGNINTTVNLAPNATATFTVIAQISASATGNLANTAIVTAPAGVTDPNPGNNSATDTDTPAPVADLAITKTDGSATYTPGGSTTYTITVTNAGPSAVVNAPVTDNFPAAITSATWARNRPVWRPPLPTWRSLRWATRRRVSRAGSSARSHTALGTRVGASCAVVSSRS